MECLLIPENVTGVQQSGPDFNRRSRPSCPSAQQCRDQLRHETESRLPPGAAVGIPGSDLSLHQEERRSFLNLFTDRNHLLHHTQNYQSSNNYITLFVIQMREE